MALDNLSAKEDEGSRNTWITKGAEGSGCLHDVPRMTAAGRRCTRSMVTHIEWARHLHGLHYVRASLPGLETIAVEISPLHSMTSGQNVLSPGYVNYMAFLADFTPLA